MKGILISFLIMASGFVHAEDLETIDVLLSHTDTEMNLDLNASTVRCLEGDYGVSSLKISVPQLREVTFFRHTTTGEVQPCINAGRCRFAPAGSGKSPEDIIDSSRPTEKVSVSVDRFERLKLDHSKKTCQRLIVENVFSRVRNVDFRHVDGGSLGETNYETCLKLKDKKS